MSEKHGRAFVCTIRKSSAGTSACCVRLRVRTVPGPPLGRSPDLRFRTVARRREAPCEPGCTSSSSWDSWPSWHLACIRLEQRISIGARARLEGCWHSGTCTERATVPGPPLPDHSAGSHSAGIRFEQRSNVGARARLEGRWHSGLFTELAFGRLLIWRLADLTELRGRSLCGPVAAHSDVVGAGLIRHGLDTWAKDLVGAGGKQT